MPKWPTNCFCLISRASVRRSAENASHWVYRQSSLQGIPSKNPFKGEGKTSYDRCEGRCVLNYLCWMLSNLCIMKRLGGCWEHRMAVKNKDPKNGITMHVQVTAHTINCMAGSTVPWEGGQLGKRRVLQALVIQQRRPKMRLCADCCMQLLITKGWWA